MSLIEKITSTDADRNELLVFYLGQAGFLLKPRQGTLVAIDTYLSDAAERLFGFKRMIPAVLEPKDLNVDLYLSTHSHIDHLDIEILPAVSQNAKTFFIGSPDCEEVYKENGIHRDRYCILKTGDTHETQNFHVRAVYADHGDLAPDAVGLLLETGGVKIFHAGDTAFAPERISESLRSEIDILIAPINGMFGNMNAREACQLAEILKPKVLIASHFWMFLEHVGENGCGDPATFLRESQTLSKPMTSLVMAPGEMLRYKKQ